jgi:hypothetical protein
VLIDGVFIPAEELVNGTSILPISPKSRKLEYYHLLLETHEAVFAEGLATATLQLTGRDHESFDNFAELEHLHGGQIAGRMRPYSHTLSYGGREHLKGLLRLGVSPIIKVRDPLQEIRDRIAERGDELMRAKI